MSTRTTKEAPVRPGSIAEENSSQCSVECCLQQKIDTALSILSLFLDATKPYLMNAPSEESVTSFVRQLKPKEESTYIAALDWLERYLDSRFIQIDRPASA